MGLDGIYSCFTRMRSCPLPRSVFRTQFAAFFISPVVSSLYRVKAFVQKELQSKALSHSDLTSSNLKLSQHELFADRLMFLGVFGYFIDLPCQRCSSKAFSAFLLPSDFPRAPFSNNLLHHRSCRRRMVHRLPFHHLLYLSAFRILVG